MAQSVQIKGLEECISALKELDKALRGKILRKGLRAAGRIIRKEVQARAPVGQTKQLKKAVKVRSGKRKKNRVSLTVGIGKKDFTGEQFYGSFLEYGAKRKDKSKGWRIEPRRFMKDAFAVKSRAASKAALDMMMSEIEKVAKGKAKGDDTNEAA